jgi:hypothetical protein
MANEVFEPILVVGAPRSGTSLLTVLLDRHDEIVMTPESKLFHDLPRDWHRRKRITHEQLIDSFLYPTHLSNLRLSKAEVLEEFRRYEPTYPNYVRCALECYGRKYGKERVGEKTPQHLWYVPTVLEWYPKAKIVWLLRDGRDTVVSIDRLHRRGIRRSSFYWRTYAVLGLKWEERYPDQIFRCRFEDLILRTDETLKSLCSFLGVAPDKKMLDNHIGSETILCSELSFKRRSLQALDPAKVGEYKRLTTERERWVMASAMEPILLRLGYPPTEVAACPVKERLKNVVFNVPWSILYDPKFTLSTDRTRFRVILGKVWNSLSGIKAKFSSMPCPSEPDRI